MDLKDYLNIDKLTIKPKEEEDDPNEKSFRHLFYVKKQRYFKEKIYQNSKIEDVFKELRQNNVGQITRIVPYDNLVFIQYEVMR